LKRVKIATIHLVSKLDGLNATLWQNMLVRNVAFDI